MRNGQTKAMSREDCLEPFVVKNKKHYIYIYIYICYYYHHANLENNTRSSVLLIMFIPQAIKIILTRFVQYK